MRHHCRAFSSIVGICFHSIIYVFHFLLSFFQIEMMSESIDETLDKDEAEEETEELTNQVNYWQPDFFSFFNFLFFLLGPLYSLPCCVSNFYILSVGSWWDWCGYCIPGTMLWDFPQLHELPYLFFLVVLNNVNLTTLLLIKKKNLTTVWFWYELTVIFSSKRPDCIKECWKCCS